ncbi:hypothetical protein HYU15_00855 [Candidatus Woesearchaeota archaeon]|nr:hypothetical protein [Candidatus Woesearchaeota archaeon]
MPKTTRRQSPLSSKKAVAAWISWVLLVGLSVVIAMFVLGWARGLVTKHGEDIKERADYAALCENLDIRLESICQNTQTLNMNVSNNNNLKVESIMVRMVDIYKELKIVKQGLLQKIEVIPATFSGSKRIVCQNKKVTSESIPICI